MNWMELARTIIEKERQRERFLRPPLTRIILRWRDGAYIGGLQPVDQEIALLSKSTHTIASPLEAALLELDGDRIVITGATELDLTGRLHFVHWRDRIIERLTDTQTRRAMELARTLTIFDVLP